MNIKEKKDPIIDVACALIVDESKRLFAAQRSSLMSLPSKWELPGGKLEADESPEQCLHREIKEELDIEVEILDQLASSTHCYPALTIKLIPFICRQINGEITLKEHADFKWIAPDELFDLDWAPADIPILKFYLDHIAAR